MNSDPLSLVDLGAAVREASEPVSMILETTESHAEFGGRLAAVARRIADGTRGAIPLTQRPGGGPDQQPRLILRSGGRDAVVYRAVPEGHEEGPFLGALMALAGGSGAVLPSIPDKEISIVVFVTPECPNCPHTVRAATTIAAVNRHVRVTVVDAVEFEAEAGVVGVRSVPMTVVDDTLTIVGLMTAEELAERILAAQGPDGEGAILVSLIDTGRFAAAAQRLVAGLGRGAFLKRWRSSTLESRIGLVLTAEEALGQDVASLDELVMDLLPFLEVEDPALRGDTADLLGRIGDPRARPALEKLCRDPVEDVAEIAGDALDDIGQRDGG